MSNSLTTLEALSMKQKLKFKFTIIKAQKPHNYENTHVHSPGTVQFPFLSLHPSRQTAGEEKVNKNKIKLYVFY